MKPESKNSVRLIAEKASSASRALAACSSPERTEFILGMADGVEGAAEEILKGNAVDVAKAEGVGQKAAIIDRLRLDRERLNGIIAAMRHVASLPDPVGKLLEEKIRPNGLRILKERVPIGVIGIVYEARPNVTADSAVLCVRSGNAVILRGGTDAFATNTALARAIIRGGEARGLPAGAVSFIENPDRGQILELVRLEGVVDLVIPRGGEALVRAVTEGATVPVLKHYKGVCHTFVDASADLEMATRICENAKCQRPGVCNAMETLLVHKDIAPAFLQLLGPVLTKAGVELRGDEVAVKHLPGAKAATENDWYEEYLDLILAVRVVVDVNEAVAHINKYGSRHSDTIVAADPVAQDIFSSGVDSAVVYVNASTRFTDGGEFGLGAEIGISTDKLHARGPMGLEELTTYRYLVLGEGQVR